MAVYRCCDCECIYSVDEDECPRCESLDADFIDQELPLTDFPPLEIGEDEDDDFFFDINSSWYL